MAKTSDGVRVAYLTGHYPAVSHTFILREVEALRSLGAKVRTYAIRRPSADHLRGTAEQEAARDTFYVLATAKRIIPLLAAQTLMFRQPSTYFATLLLALSMRAPGLRALIYQLIYFAEATIIADDLRRHNVTHLHNHFADVSANVAVLAAKLSDIPFSFTLHGPAELFAPERWKIREKVRHARFVACISHFARSQAMYFSDPDDWPKLRIIHCGVIPEMYQHPKTPMPGKTHLVYVGRLTAIKGVRVLLQAFSEALKSNPDLHLTIVGDGDDRAKLETLSAPDAEKVTFSGYLSQEDVAATLATADAFVLPSFAEGLPVVLMEALAASIPVICTQVAGVSELVEDGKSGFIVPPGDVDTLRDRILKLAADPDLRANMGQTGQARVASEFDVRTEAARLLTLFEGDPAGSARPTLPTETGDS